MFICNGCYVGTIHKDCYTGTPVKELNGFQQHGNPRSQLVHFPPVDESLRVPVIMYLTQSNLVSWRVGMLPLKDKVYNSWFVERRTCTMFRVSKRTLAGWVFPS